MRKISIMLAALAVLSVSAVCPANTAISSVTTKVAQADTFTIGTAKRATALRQSASSSGKKLQTIPKGATVEVFSYRNGYSYVVVNSTKTLGWVKSSDLSEHTGYR